MIAEGAQEDRVIVDALRRAMDQVIAVYRFGSSAHGAAAAGSDVDIAVLAPQRIPGEQRFDVQEMVAAAIGRDVDLVDLASASPVMAIQVVVHGRLLYDGDSDARGRFEDLT